jgi:hypothetical protein
VDGRGRRELCAAKKSRGGRAPGLQRRRWPAASPQRVGRALSSPRLAGRPHLTSTTLPCPRLDLASRAASGDPAGSRSPGAVLVTGRGAPRGEYELGADALDLGSRIGKQERREV